MLLAQATSAAAASGLSASSIGTVVLSLGVLASLAIAVFGMFLSRREHEAHKEEVGRRITTVEENVAGLNAEISLVRAEIHSSELRLATAGEHRAEALHVRFNEVMSGLAELRGRVNATPH